MTFREPSAAQVLMLLSAKHSDNGHKSCTLRTSMDKHKINCTRFVCINKKEMDWSSKNPFMMD